MEGGFEKFCKLCQNKMVESDLKLTEDVVKEMDVFLRQINFNSKTSLICNACMEKLLAAFRFKSACLYTDDLIFPYTDGEETSHLDLMEIYMEVNNDQNLKEVLDDQQICRLCFKPEKIHFKMISEMNPDALVKFLPEVNFAATINSVICMKCHDALHAHSTFIRNCLDADKNNTTDEVVVGDTLFTNPSIKTEEVDIKPEPIDNESLFKIFGDIKKEENDEGDTSLNFPNGLLEIAENKNLYDIDELKQTSAHSTVTNYVSAKCIYKTPSESRFACRDLRHKKYSKIRVNNNKEIKYIYIYKKPKSTTNDLKLRTYQYNKCIFNTGHKYIFIKEGNLLTHQRKHKDSQVRMYRCDQCDYQSNRKFCLKEHLLMHKDPSEVRMFKCDECDYKCNRKGSLRIHQLTHKDPSEMRMFKCDECDYESFHKGNLLSHQLRHKDPSEVQMFKCDQCDYKSNRKFCLKQHLLIHKDPSKRQVFKCDKCGYKCKQKVSLLKHELIHKDYSQVQMHRCDKCKYITKYKDSLDRHYLRHRREEVPSEAPKCSSALKASIKASLKKILTSNS